MIHKDEQALYDALRVLSFRTDLVPELEDGLRGVLYAAISELDNWRLDSQVVPHEPVQMLKVAPLGRAAVALAYAIIGEE